MDRDEIVAEGRRYLAAGTRWSHQGRTIKGVDCIGLVCVVGTAFGIEYEDRQGYSRNPDGTFVDHILRYMVYRNPQTIEKGCVVVLRDHINPCHVGIITERYGRFYLLHSSVGKKRVVEEEWTEQWRSRVRCYLDYPGVIDG